MKNKRSVLNLCFISVLILLHLIYTAILTPISVQISTDIIYSESIAPTFIEIGFELCQLLIWCWLFSFIIGSVYNASGVVFVSVSSAIVSMLRYAIVPIIDVTLNDTALSSGDIMDALIYFLLDLAQIIAPVLIANVILKKPSVKGVKKSVFICALMISAIRILMRIRYDVFYGPPADLLDLMWMIIYYTSDIVYGIISFFVMMLILNIFTKNKTSDA